jgi:hypothetical protein
MSKNEYHFQVHSFVMLEPSFGMGERSFEGPCEIVHHLGDRVWVPATYADKPFNKAADIVEVGDGRNNGYDESGNCIVSIHVRHVTRYLTDAEAEGVMMYMDADRKLLSYAQ